jgi:septal ring factor EnvC (AmiA/AmiB activator)
VEAENRNLQAEVRSLRGTIRGQEAQLKQLEAYAEEIRALQTELQETRRKLAAEQEQKHELMEAQARSQQDSNLEFALPSAGEMTPMAMVQLQHAAQRIRELEDLVVVMEERIQELKEALALQLQDFESERSFLFAEAERHRKAVDAASALLSRLKQKHEEELQMLRMDLEEKTAVILLA